MEDTYALPFVATGFGVGFVAVFASQRVRRRSRLLTCGFYAGLAATAYMVLFGQAQVAMGTGWEMLLLAAPLLGGIVTTMLAGALLPALESIFHMTTDISWLEQADLNHPLMRRLSIEAPGTYHHSLVVANLSEAAAEAIGANASMCRVCCYFHDIGKLSKPEYFIENMSPDDNPHDDLTARMSALVLIAHVKDGVDLALKHKLNSRIIDVIEQHHGNSLVYFFYRRALDQKKEIIRLVEQDKAREDDVPEVTEEGFRYPGPKPQFKESAIISLADAVESASRTPRQTDARARGADGRGHRARPHPRPPARRVRPHALRARRDQGQLRQDPAEHDARPHQVSEGARPAADPDRERHHRGSQGDRDPAGRGQGKRGLRFPAMPPRIQLYNHQSRHPAPLELWQTAAERALPLCLAAATSPASELHALEEIEINLVDDTTIARVHGEFLNDPTPTDVITFPHGEIFISLDTAQRQAAENGETYEREVALYIVHALLHLAGWDDREPGPRARPCMRSRSGFLSQSGLRRHDAACRKA